MLLQASFIGSPFGVLLVNPELSYGEHWSHRLSTTAPKPILCDGYLKNLPTGNTVNVED